MTENQLPPPAKRPRSNPAGSPWQSWIDELIHDAQERGLFDNLRGQGKPLPNRRNPYLPEERQLAYDLVQDSGHTLAWLDDAKDIKLRISKAQEQLASDYAWYQTQVQETGKTKEVEATWQRHRHRFEQALNEINRLIDTYNLKSPSPQFHLYRLRLDEELDRLH